MKSLSLIIFAKNNTSEDAPRVGHFKLNFDRSANPGVAGMGGLIHDSAATTIISF